VWRVVVDDIDARRIHDVSGTVVFKQLNKLFSWMIRILADF
jgi:hypothetical protein